MTKIASPTDETLAHAAALLRAGKLVAFPTETVYGLGADATRDDAVRAIYAAKGRPSNNPLIIHFADAGAAEAHAALDGPAYAAFHALATAFWPGPLTLVVPRKPDSPLSPEVSAGLDSVALRVPSHPVALALLRESGLPLAAPSANPSGGVSPTTARHVADGLAGRLALILDGGPCAVGIESSVLDLSAGRPRLLRPGGVTREAIEAIIGPIDVGPLEGAARSPGLIGAHYAPRLPVRLNAGEAPAGWALLGFGGASEATLSLSPGSDLAEAATNLYAMLRALDRPEFAGIAVSPIPAQGLGLAINDRLKRAAQGR